MIIFIALYVVASVLVIMWLDAQRKIVITRNRRTLELNKQAENEFKKIQNNIQDATQKLKETQNTIKETEHAYECLKNAYDKFKNVLDDKKNDAIEKTSKEIDEHKTALNQVIEDIMQSYNNKMKIVQEQLTENKKRIVAYAEDLKRKQEMEKDKSFYTLEVSQIDLEDIAKLLNLALTLHQPDVLRKLVYKTFFEKKMNELLGRVAGTKAEQSAVYKITHIDSGMCYIGQTTNVKERWRKHLKCGLGIETPATNSFYQGLMKYGVWNFTWEIIEFCPKEKLNEIEKYWIDFYQTNTWGWNSKGGNSK